MTIRKVVDQSCVDGYYYEEVLWYGERKLEMSRTPPSREWGGYVRLGPEPHEFATASSRKISEVRATLKERVDEKNRSNCNTTGKLQPNQ